MLATYLLTIITSTVMIAPKKRKPPKMATAMIPSRLYLVVARLLCDLIDEGLPNELANTGGWWLPVAWLWWWLCGVEGELSAGIGVAKVVIVVGGASDDALPVVEELVVETSVVGCCCEGICWFWFE